jgi:hypothetical protein
MASTNVFLTSSGNGSQVPVSGTNRTGGTGDVDKVARLRKTLDELLGGSKDVQLTTSQAYVAKTHFWCPLKSEDTAVQMLTRGPCHFFL